MLSAPVGIVSPSSLGGGLYDFQLFFQSAGQAKFLRVGDVVKDSVGNEYSITTWAGSPSDFSSSGIVTASFVTLDILPVADVGFDSTVFTPGQQDVRPAVQTPGSIFGITTFSGQTFEYQLSASWTINSEALKAVAGDRIVDSLGKEFEITFLNVGQFTVPFRMKEVEDEGVSPAVGIATLYRMTENSEFFQGSELTDPARTNIFNRDNFLLDIKLKELEDAIASGGTSEAIQLSLTNNSGTPLAALIPVRTFSGSLETVDASDEAHVKDIIGVTVNSIANTAAGDVMAKGLMKDISTLFNVNDELFLSTTGDLTSTIPDIGVGGFSEGDFVVRFGHIVQNESDPGKKDLQVRIELRGQL